MSKSTIPKQFIIFLFVGFFTSSCNNRTVEVPDYNMEIPPPAVESDSIIDSVEIRPHENKIVMPQDSIKSNIDYRTLNDSAIALFRNGEAFKAYLIMNRSININANNADSYYIRGLVSQTAFNLYYGKRDFEKALELNPNHVDATMKLAIIFGKNNDRASACQYLKKACDLGSSEGCEGYNKFCSYQ